VQFLSTIQHKFGFTKNETKVVLFLSGTLLLGTTIRYLKPMIFPGASPSQQFDYSAIDSEFKQRSSQASIAAPLNQAPPLKETRQPSAKKDRAPLPGSISINTGTKADLMRLPGIGERYAERIIMYREDNGAFESIEQLNNIKGIGKKTLERIRPFLKL